MVLMQGRVILGVDLGDGDERWLGGGPGDDLR